VCNDYRLPMRRVVLALIAAAFLCATAGAQSVVLDGGSFVRFERPASITFDGGADEWEAFLSLDGGNYYAVRITPHLDADVRSFVWRVPNVASRDARILIRVGDEHRERAIELQSTFTIVPDPLHIERDFGSSSANGAEAARPGDPNVNEWTAGDRRGANLAAHKRDDASIDACRELNERDAPDAESSAIAIRHDLPATARLCSGGAIFRRVVRALSRDLLQQTNRLNI